MNIVKHAKVRDLERKVMIVKLLWMIVKLLWIVVAVGWAINLLSLIMGYKQDKLTIGCAYFMALIYALINAGL